jgi:cyclopropane-fatty-acyl-phospholipid synthase
MTTVMTQTQELPRPPLPKVETLSGWQKKCRKTILKAFLEMPQGSLALTDEHDAVHHTAKKNQFPQAEMKIHSPLFYEHVFKYGHIGIGEAYMLGYWDSPNVESVVAWGIANVNALPILEGAKGAHWAMKFFTLSDRIQHWLKPNNQEIGQQNIRAHYDLSNDFFALFLDPTMAYSAARFEQEGQTLEDAQFAKYDALCKKLNLQPEDHLLEIGTGWGGLAIHAVYNYNCRVTTITNSKEQYELAKKRVDDRRFAHIIDVRLEDYRHLQGPFDKIVSVEMIEAVGDAYYEEFFKTCDRILAPDGMMAFQMITCPDSRYRLLKNNVDFIQKHIFPGSLIPSMARLTEALNQTSDLYLFSLEEMGMSYVKTLREWDARFLANLPEVKKLGFDDVFLRKWHYYFAYCSAAFLMRNIHLVQAVYTRPNNVKLNENAYLSVL